MPKHLTYLNKYSKFHLLLNSIISILLFYLNYTDCTGQLPFTITQPQLSVTNDSLMIAYDILGANSDDKFYIWMEVTDTSGKRIGAYSLDGDIGDSIPAGSNKQIIWNLHADNIFIDNTLNIEIFAEKLVTSKNVSEVKNITEESLPAVTRVKVGKHLLKSTIFPGWGLTSLSKGKPYWLLGVVGIGCIATSYYYNQQAHLSYDEYQESSDDDITGYYDNAITQRNISKAFAWSAAAIWIADLGILCIKASSMNKSYKRSRTSAFSISPFLDLTTNTPIFTLRYNFQL